MEKNYLKICSIPLIIREIPVKTQDIALDTIHIGRIQALKISPAGKNIER